MIENSLFSTNLVGSEGFYWWIGQIVDNKTWKDNIVKSKFEDPSEIKGYGARYKVRIFGHHTEKKDDINDMDLPWANIMYPVTAGGGQGGFSQTATLKQGNIVFGFFLDGIEAQQPVIIGILGNNDQTKLQKSIPQKGFIPTSGHANGELVPTFGKPGESSKGTPSSTPSENGGVSSGKGSATNSGLPIEGDGSNVNKTNNNDIEQKKDGDSKLHLAKSQKCGGSDLDGISLEIEKLMKAIERIKKKVDSFNNAASNIQSKISELVQKAAKCIARFFKSIIDGIRKFIMEKIQHATKELYSKLFPNERTTLKKLQEKVLDLLGCLFNKIIGALVGMIAGALSNALDKMVNTAACAVENIIGSLLGKILGLIQGAIDNILKPLQALFAAFGAVLSFAGEILGLLKQLLGFLLCDEEGDCPEAKQWGFWNGVGDNGGLGASLTSMFSKAQEIGSQFQNIGDIDNFDFSSLGSLGGGIDPGSGGCGVGPKLCGPPTVSFFSSTGFGAVANAIVGSTGEVLGLDIISGGSGYNNSTTVSINDACGQGNNAVGKVNVGPNGEITGVTMINPGFGYSPQYNGSLGGMGRTWAENYQTSVKRSDGTYDTPYNPGKLIQVCPGDEVIIPFYTTAEIYNENGIITETLVGGKNIVKKECGTFTTPRISDEDVAILNEQGLSPQAISNLGLDSAVTSFGTYPVITKICDVLIKNQGINYSPKDKITINPSKGSILEPVFGPFGILESVNIIESGSGFTEVPEITIKSETGYNAVIIPLMCVNRKGNDLVGEETLVTPANIISVVDCVGKV
jgi:hypothetical protein